MAASEQHATSVGTQYMFSRSFRDSARLHLQHWIWKEHLGYLIHPTIDVASFSSSTRVADVGTGNGCWLLDLAQTTPSSWSLEGFDVSDAQYPVEAQLPENVKLSVLDAFEPVPNHLSGAFDIVHVRAFAAVVKNGNPDILLRNLITLLKPGGILQWDEFDSSTFSADSGTTGQSSKNAEEIIRVWGSLAQELSLRLEWMQPGVMEANFVKHGLEMLNDSHKDRWTSSSSFKPLLRKPYTDNWMMALEEVCFLMISRRESKGQDISAGDFSGLLQRVVEETKNGVNLWIDLQVVVGQKKK